MKLQHKIITTFKFNYPELTYKQVAEMTGIQKTRVFRIFNGSELKVSELEIIEFWNQKATLSCSLDFLETAKKCLTNLNHKILSKILIEMQYSLSASELCH